MLPRVALVTGAGRRIGASIAQTLHAAGFHVVIHCRTALSEAQALADRLNKTRVDSACVLTANLMEHEACVDLVARALAWQGRLNLLVNNASLFIRTPFPGLYEDAWAKMWLTNVNAPFWLSVAAYPALAAQTDGCIINLTDIHAEKPLKDYGLYCQTKAALKMQTDVLAMEYAPLVRVNAVAPGAIVWPEADNALSLATQTNIMQKTLLQCHGDPYWVATAVLALVENAFITGQTLRVDGGRVS